MPSLLKANRRVLKTAIALQWRAIIVLSRYSTYYSVSVSSTLLSSSREGGTAARELLRARHQIDVRLQHRQRRLALYGSTAQHSTTQSPSENNAKRTRRERTEVSRPQRQQVAVCACMRHPNAPQRHLQTDRRLTAGHRTSQRSAGGDVSPRLRRSCWPPPEQLQRRLLRAAGSERAPAATPGRSRGLRHGPAGASVAGHLLGWLGVRRGSVKSA